MLVWRLKKFRVEMNNNESISVEQQQEYQLIIKLILINVVELSDQWVKSKRLSCKLSSTVVGVFQAVEHGRLNFNTGGIC
ncbi:hypothetical protein T4D_15575 [Trichinella pseudospiralis]|uniref:Uncharacterized protein n=1 Tax=Trichinella pseudospiralis TaxID=6337 RepID=A0A0V1FCH3_TRIPS|nr:hypothetical protein T4D_15575 [Trichinella pseudospiralis]